ncbi:fatty acid desaturase [Oscillatoria sp. FACHB-1407]|uniref:fatty acid desaturase family protein n=1 Tax=Oscillatoria sp. FACHB-1407 TaxID=2692847 RepID=UPI001688FC91|nr:fatty acid desaturase [Oscillatoria sp. FACHB-1407]MBD2461138.1 fatty acid desaturase [Oscillatoria sp. FACHB-1407]
MVTAVEVNLTSFLHRQKPVLNAIAIFYTLASYVGGIALLLLPNGWLNALGVVVLTHSLIYSAYLSHEFMHSSIFVGRRWNAFWGDVMLWLNGGCYGRFDDLAKRHIGHHVNRVDFAGFDLPKALQQMPSWVRNSILTLEWLYFPVISLWLQWRSLTAPFWRADRREERSRIVAILLIRGALFTLLGFVSLKALLLYFVAYIGMITVLRWMDAFQHTYEVIPIDQPLPDRDRAHEQENTFSTVLSLKHPWLNVLLLNFGYHNAHHELMKCPWYALPELDRTLFSGHEVHYIPLTQLLWNYHRFRITRIFSGQGVAVDQQRNPTPETFYGAVGVSFLVINS